jgi:hypothetical protein
VSCGIEFEDIGIGNYMKIFGLMACENGGIPFYAFIIITSDEPDEEDYGLPPVVNENNVSRFLPADTYRQDLVVNGNNFRLTGEAGSEGCGSEDGWSLIRGEVSINGNNAVFENIRFEGKVKEKGNNTKFINCCFDRD